MPPFPIPSLRLDCTTAVAQTTTGTAPKNDSKDARMNLRILHRLRQPAPRLVRMLGGAGRSSPDIERAWQLLRPYLSALLRERQVGASGVNRDSP